MKRNCKSRQRISLRFEERARPVVLSRALLKLSVEAELGSEMEEHLGDEPHAASGRNSGTAVTANPKRPSRGLW